MRRPHQRRLQDRHTERQQRRPGAAPRIAAADGPDARPGGAGGGPSVWGRTPDGHRPCAGVAIPHAAAALGAHGKAA